MTLLIPFAALAAMLPLAPAPAEPAARAEIVRFNYAEAVSNDGRAALERRIRRAAAAVCGEAFDFDLAGQNDVRRCRRATVADATEALTSTLAAKGSALTVAANR